MTAPLFADLARGPEDGYAAWVRAADGRRLRVAAFGRAARGGTVFLLPGRTEYIEKYGPTAQALLRRGYATVSLDFRGQGLADRALDDPLPGHVSDFAEYQLDIQATLGFAAAQGLPRPWFLLAHSMGGAIGLRSLMGRHPFRAAAFSAPMWGILIPTWQRPFARPGARLACRLGLGGRYAPGTGPVPYVSQAPFQDNTLTRDPDIWAEMARHLQSEPRLALGGPTLTWLAAALAECDALADQPSPDLPALVGLGSNERIVDPDAIRARMPRWPRADLAFYEAAEHEILMDRPAEDFLDRAVALFAAA